jgi:MFS transporter, DHA1 family, multidrug resistance protein
VTLEARVCTAAFFVYLGIGATGPILPEVRRSLALSAADIGIVVAAFGLARLCVDLPGGALAARLGFRIPFLLGSLLLAAGSTWSAVTAGVPGLVTGQILAGIGCVFCHVTALVVLSSQASAGTSGRTMGFYFGATFAGLALGGAIAGQIAAVLGWRAAFLGAATASLAGFLVVLLPGRRPAASAPRPGPSPGSARWRPLLAPHLLSVYLLHFTALFLWAGVRTAVWPFIASEVGGLSVRAIGLALGIGSFVTLGTLASAGALSDRWGKVPVITVGLLASVAGLAVPLLATSAGALLASLLLLDLGQGILAPSASALLADVHRSTPGIGTATGLMRLLGDLGWLVGPLAVTSVIERLDYSAGLAVATLVPLGNLLLLRVYRLALQTGESPGCPVAAGAGPRGG